MPRTQRRQECQIESDGCDGGLLCSCEGWPPVTPGLTSMEERTNSFPEDPEDWVSRLLELDAGQALPLDDLVSRLCGIAVLEGPKGNLFGCLLACGCFLQLDSDFLNSEVTSEQSCARYTFASHLLEFLQLSSSGSGLAL